jgi:hypothetical protein
MGAFHKTDQIKIPLQAKDPVELALKSWATQILNGKTYTFYNEQQLKDGTFICWYYGDIQNDKHIDKIDFSKMIDQGDIQI